MDVRRARDERTRQGRKSATQQGEAAPTPSIALMQLQATAGNAAVARLVEEEQPERLAEEPAAEAEALEAAKEPEAAPAASDRPSESELLRVASDVEDIVRILGRPALDERAENEIVAAIQRWASADRLSGRSDTPLLDELLRRLKGRPMHRRTVRSMEAETAETAYDALWIALGEERLGAFAGAASISDEGSAGPLAGDRAGFWAGLEKGKAMGLYSAFEAVSPAVDRNDADSVARLSRALASIEADPEWMQMVRGGGDNKGSKIFGSDYEMAERVLMDSETAKVSHAGARYLWRMVDSAEEDLPWLGERVEPSEAAREVVQSSREIASRIAFHQKGTTLSTSGIQRDSRVLAEVVKLTGWITRLAAKAHGLDDSSSREFVRRIAREVGRELERTGAHVRAGDYERKLIDALERPERDLPERQEDVAGVLLDIVAAAAEQLVESGHPGGGGGGDSSGSPEPPKE